MSTISTRKLEKFPLPPPDEPHPILSSMPRSESFPISPNYKELRVPVTTSDNEVEEQIEAPRTTREPKTKLVGKHASKRYSPDPLDSLLKTSAREETASAAVADNISSAVDTTFARGTTSTGYWADEAFSGSIQRVSSGVQELTTIAEAVKVDKRRRRQSDKAGKARQDADMVVSGNDTGEGSTRREAHDLTTTARGLSKNETSPQDLEYTSDLRHTGESSLSPEPRIGKSEASKRENSEDQKSPSPGLLVVTEPPRPAKVKKKVGKSKKREVEGEENEESDWTAAALPKKAARKGKKKNIADGKKSRVSPRKKKKTASPEVMPVTAVMDQPITVSKGEELETETEGAEQEQVDIIVHRLFIQLMSLCRRYHRNHCHPLASPRRQKSCPLTGHLSKRQQATSCLHQVTVLLLDRATSQEVSDGRPVSLPLCVMVKLSYIIHWP